MIWSEGNTGPVVQAIQHAVGAAADGKWGPLTTAAVKAWQSCHGLKPDGLVGPLTRAKMFTDLVHGIDVSHWQGAIDWAAVAASGVRFAWCKAGQGYGGKDPRWLENVAGCNENGILVGAYHFAVPDRRPDDALTEARHCVARMAGLQLELPPVLDLELNGARLAPAELEDWALTWLAEVAQLTGRRPVLYSGNHFLRKHANGGARIAASGCRLWVARYRGGQHTDPGPTGGFTSWAIWQHSCTGKVPGIDGNVDLNVLADGEATLADLVED